MSHHQLLEATVLMALIGWSQRYLYGEGENSTRIVNIQNISGPTYRRFREHFAGLFPEIASVLARPELDAVWNAIKRDYPSYRDWWRRLVSCSGIDISFSQREPVVSVDTVERWELMLDGLDGDAFVTRKLCDLREDCDPDSDIRALSGWKTVVRASDRDLRALMSEGVSDLHIHVGGARFAHMAWFDLMDGITKADRYKGIARSKELKLIIIDAIAARKSLWDAVSKNGHTVPEERPLTDDGESWWRWRSERLIGERILLGRCWKYQEDEQFDRILDRYLVAKSRFFAAARQPFSSAPGLDVFKEFFNSIKRDSTSEGKNARLQMQPIGDALAFLTETPELRRIEVRFTPPDKPVKIAQAAEGYGKLLENIQVRRTKDDPPLDVRIALHLSRSRGRAGKHADLEKTLSIIDRQTASLRLAINNDAYRTVISPVLARIDVAGQERNTSIIEMAPYIRLAAGDDEALNALHEMFHVDPTQTYTDPRRDEYSVWQKVVKQDGHRARLDMPRLGITVHAGEDFADPLSGLHEIASAIDFIDLRPGDGIGHGLALAVDHDQFMEKRGRFGMIRRGSHIDSVVWMLDFLESTDEFELQPSLHNRLRRSAEEEATEIYKDMDVYKEILGNVRLRDIRRLRKARGNLAIGKEFQGDSVLAKLWQCDREKDVRKRRDELIPLPKIRFDIGQLVRNAQQQMLELVKSRRIIIELNPASNLRITASSGLANSPAVDLLLESANGLQVCINTDNPGIFLGRIENEYALLMAGCRQRKVAESQIFTLLNQARLTGLQRVYWPM